MILGVCSQTVSTPVIGVVLGSGLTVTFSKTDVPGHAVVPGPFTWISQMISTGVCVLLNNCWLILSPISPDPSTAPVPLGSAIIQVNSELATEAFMVMSVFSSLHISGVIFVMFATGVGSTTTSTVTGLPGQLPNAGPVGVMMYSTVIGALPGLSSVSVILNPSATGPPVALAPEVPLGSFTIQVNVEPATSAAISISVAVPSQMLSRWLTGNAWGSGYT